MLISFLDLASRGGRDGALLIVTRTDFTISFLLLPLVGIVLGVNFEDIFDLSVLVFWSVLSYTSPPVWKQRSRSETTSELYKPTFLATHLIAVLQPSEYFVFHDGDTPIQLSLP